MGLLTDLKIQKATYQKPGTNPSRRKATSNKLRDGDGLFLRLMPVGSKLWQFRYKFPVTDPATQERRLKENVLSFGAYPSIPLATRTEDGIQIRGARELAEKARRLIAQGIDPATRRDLFRPGTGSDESSFEAVAREWYETRKDHRSSSFRKTTLLRLEKHVFPYLGQRNIDVITPTEVLKVLRRVCQWTLQSDSPVDT